MSIGRDANRTLTREVISDVERVANAHHMRLRATCGTRGQGPAAWKAWEEAAAEWHALRFPTDRLWSDGFVADLRASRREAIEDAILFLEADPWYFRSGYLKERLIRGLKAADLTEQDRRRLRNVIWNVAAGKNRREFRNYCSLANAIGDTDMIRRLEDVSPERNVAAKGKFAGLLGCLYRNMKPSGKEQTRGDASGIRK